MNLTTVVELKPCPQKLDYQSPVLMLGSCFSDNIGSLLKDCRLPVSTNPFGVLYNPFSISLLIRRSLEGKWLNDAEVFEEQGIYKSFLFHSSFSGAYKAAYVNQCNAKMAEVASEMKQAKIIFITLGTARYYRLVENNSIVANCHKQPADHFVQELASPEDCYKDLSETIAQIRQVNPDAFFVFTISPVRHLKDGAFGNQLNKSVLFLAIQKLLDIPGTFYFPAYELMMDEMRDYRFYDEDLLHPSKIAVDYIWEKFCRVFMVEKTIALSQKAIQINKALSHRVQFPESKAYRDFSANLKKQIEQFQNEVKLPLFNEEWKTL